MENESGTGCADQCSRSSESQGFSLPGPLRAHFLGWMGKTDPEAPQERKCLLPTFPQSPTQGIPQGIPQTAQRRLTQQRQQELIQQALHVLKPILWAQI